MVYNCPSALPPYVYVILYPSASYVNNLVDFHRNVRCPDYLNGLRIVPFICDISTGIGFNRVVYSGR